MLLEKILTDIVWLLPKKIIYLSAIRLIAYATEDKYEKTIVSELTAMKALKRWENFMKKGE